MQIYVQICRRRWENCKSHRDERFTRKSLYIIGLVWTSVDRRRWQCSGHPFRQSSSNILILLNKNKLGFESPHFTPRLFCVVIDHVCEKARGFDRVDAIGFRSAKLTNARSHLKRSMRRHDEQPRSRLQRTRGYRSPAQRRGFIEQPINPGLFEQSLPLAPSAPIATDGYAPPPRAAPSAAPPFKSADTAFTVVDLRRSHDFNGNLLNETLETTARAVLQACAPGIVAGQNDEAQLRAGPLPPRLRPCGVRRRPVKRQGHAGLANNDADLRASLLNLWLAPHWAPQGRPH